MPALDNDSLVLRLNNEFSISSSFFFSFFFLQNYFRDFWNVFDFIIVITTLVGVILELNVRDSRDLLM